MGGTGGASCVCARNSERPIGCALYCGAGVGAAGAATACRVVSANGAGSGSGSGNGRMGRAIVGSSWYAIGGVDGGVLNGVECSTAVGRR